MLAAALDPSIDRIIAAATWLEASLDPCGVFCVGLPFACSLAATFETAGLARLSSESKRLLNDPTFRDFPGAPPSNPIASIPNAPLAEIAIELTRPGNAGGCPNGNFACSRLQRVHLLKENQRACEFKKIARELSNRHGIQNGTQTSMPFWFCFAYRLHFLCT
jgi:hypothetical protein